MMLARRCVIWTPEQQRLNKPNETGRRMFSIHGVKWGYVAGASLLVLGMAGSNHTYAQTQLPPVSVDPPKQQDVQRAQPARRAARSAATSRDAIAQSA
jgi:hypothetical protein